MPNRWLHVDKGTYSMALVARRMFAIVDGHVVMQMTRLALRVKPCVTR